MATNNRRSRGTHHHSMAPVFKQDKLKPIKRPFDPIAEQPPKKTRAAFGDITNAARNNNQKKRAVKKSQKVKDILVVPRPSDKPTTEGITDTSFDIIEVSQSSNSSQGSNASSLLSSQSVFGSQSQKSTQHSTQEKFSQRSVQDENEKNKVLSQNSDQKKEETYVDIDAQACADPCLVGLYAAHIFKYYKDRENEFIIDDYIPKQKEITKLMRSILVDWLGEVQENFELNHETFYLGVKLVDLFLSRQEVTKAKLQLLGSTAMFIACKFEERCPPVLDDFLFICDDAYTRQQLISLEKTILREVDFDLGIPLSYRFLRRYAKCAQFSMYELTLARYFCEMSLMYYQFIQVRDSKMAAACLLLAMKIQKTGAWDGTMRHYTGYKEPELIPVVIELNAMISAPPDSRLRTIRTKYSHPVFHKVAFVPALTNEEITNLKASFPDVQVSPMEHHSHHQQFQDDDVMILDLS